MISTDHNLINLVKKHIYYTFGKIDHHERVVKEFDLDPLQNLNINEVHGHPRLHSQKLSFKTNSTQPLEIYKSKKK